MNYLYWENQDESDILPMRVYVEMDDEMYERRKVEFYLNNVVGYADDDREIGRTGLCDRPLPTIKELKKVISTPVVEITQEQFEDIWLKHAE